MKWVTISLSAALFCYVAGVYVLLNGYPAWIHPSLLVLGTMASISFIVSLFNLSQPYRGKLAKSLRPYLGGSSRTDVQSLFTQIDRDMRENGRKFDTVWVGKEWILDDEAMRIDRVRGIFSYSYWTSQQTEYVIFLVDQDQQILTVNTSRQKIHESLNYCLKSLVPHALTGGFKDYSAFIGIDKNLMADFNKAFERANEPRTDFVFEGMGDIPTSWVTSEGIKEAFISMRSGEHFTLSPCRPLPSRWGTCIYLSCHQAEGGSPYTIIAYFSNRDKEPRAYALGSILRQEAETIMLDYFEKNKVPDISAWEEHTPPLWELHRGSSRIRP